MNTATITGTVSTVPTCKTRGFEPTTDFDVTVTTGRRTYTLHVQALNGEAKTARRYLIGDQVAVTGYLNSEAFDMPDRSVWYRVKIVAYEVEHRQASDTDSLGGEQ
jgi:single-stranded DNA-binding protein